MTGNEREKLIREYAAGEITWHALQERGFDNYVRCWVRSANWDSGRRSRQWTGRTSPPANAAGR
jgi:hypothetical protein